MEWPRGKCAMFGLLDRATQLTSLKRETSFPEPLTCEAALKTTAPAATLLFASALRSYCLLRRRLIDAGLFPVQRRDGPRRTGLDRAERASGSADEHRRERRHGISDHHGHDLRADPPAHAIRARIARARMKSGMDVLCTAPPFKISPKPRCIRS